jgi:ACDE family multidrug resistance protein
MAENQTKPKTGTLVLSVLSAVPIIMVLGNSMLIPVLPTIQSVMDVSKFEVSLMITLFSVGAGIAIPFAGILSDRLGRRAIITPSLLIYGAGGLITGIAAVIGSGIFWLMLAGRVLQGIGAAGTAPIAMALVSDLYQKAERSQALGVIEAANGMGKVVSPIIGSLLALITWWSLFFFFPILCIPIALGIWYIIQEPDKQKKPQPLSQYKAHLLKTWERQGRWLLVAFLAGAVSLFIMFGVLFFLSDLLEKRYGVDGVLKGAILAIPLLALCTTSYLTGRYVKQKTRLMRRLIVLGLFMVAAGMALVPLISNTYLLIAILIGIGTGSGLILPCLNTLITSAVGSKERGIVTSLYGSVRFLGVAVGPPVFGALADAKWWLFLGSATLAFVIGLLSLWAIRQPQRLAGKDGQSRLFLHKGNLKPT